MFDLLIVTSSNDPYLERCLASLDTDIEIAVRIVNLERVPNPGIIFNKTLQTCTNKIFTIIESSDHFLPHAFKTLQEFVPLKSFGLIHADSINQYTGLQNLPSALPLTEDILKTVNPVRKPVFYNRKIVDYLQLFDINSPLPEFDLILKIWERFPVVRFPKALLNVRNQVSGCQEDVNKVLYDAQIRHTKQFYYAYPSMYPEGLLDPLL